MFTGDESSLYSKPYLDHLWAEEWKRRSHAHEVAPLPKEPPVPPRPVVTSHHVKRHVFANGTIWESCTATGCEFATSTADDRVQVKRHSDSAIGIYIDDTMPYVTETDDGEGIEVSQDDPAELSLEEKPIVAGDHGSS